MLAWSGRQQFTCHSFYAFVQKSCRFSVCARGEWKQQMFPRRASELCLFQSFDLHLIQQKMETKKKKKWGQNSHLSFRRVDLSWNNKVWHWNKNLNFKRSILLFGCESSQKSLVLDIGYFLYPISDFSFTFVDFNRLIRFLNLSEVVGSVSAVCLWNLQNTKFVSAAELTNKNVSWRIFRPVFRRSVCLEKSDEEATFQTKSRSCKSEHGIVQTGAEVLVTARFFRDPTQEDESWLWNHPDTRVLRVLRVQVQKKIMWNWDSLWTVPCVLMFS